MRTIIALALLLGLTVQALAQNEFPTPAGGAVVGTVPLYPSGTNSNGNTVYSPVNSSSPSYVGNAGSYTDRKTITPTVTAGAYSLGQCVGGFKTITFTGTGPINLVNDIRIASQGGGTETLTVYLFDASPSGSTCTDNGTFTLATADTAKLIMAPFALTLVAPTGATQSFGSNPNLARIPASGTTTLYEAMVAGGTFTPGSTTDLLFGVQVVQQHQ